MDEDFSYTNKPKRLEHLVDLNMRNMNDSMPELISSFNYVTQIFCLLQVNLDMTDSVGPGKLVRHMQNPSYAYDGLSPSYASVYLIALGTSVDLYIKVKTGKEYAWLDFYYTFICLLRNTRQC